QTILEKKLITPISPEEMSQEVLYVTKKGVNWYNAIQSAFYQKRTTPKFIEHIINLKSLMEKLPKLIEEFTQSPSSFLGLCETSQILKDKSIIFGITETRLVIIPFRRRLYSVNLSLLTNFNFKPTLNGEQASTPINEIVQSMGLPQYLEEIMKKKFLETILSNEKLESE
ncbi:MAG: hypothetical protein MUO85_00435, partial [candidate division Zixibacteria bacterium]|nr:hypothetical protein [candidate division Zixibacteria bacterium]